MHCGPCLQNSKAERSVVVTSEVEADWREFAGYLIEFQFQDMLKLIARELDIPRAAEELSTLNSQSRLRFPFSEPGIRVLPETFQLHEDFATNNYEDCFEIKWSKDMTTLPTVSETGLLTFWRVAPKRQSQERLPTRFTCVPC